MISILSFSTFIMASPSDDDNVTYQNNSLNGDQSTIDQANRTSFSGIIVINSTDWSLGNYSVISVIPLPGYQIPTSNVTVISYETVNNNVTVTTTETTSTLTNSIFIISIGILSIWVIKIRIRKPEGEH
ncbi:MAG: hypothetical protein ACXAD7_28465 [Candidatus Kariarchaeaceae archaeon]